MSRPTREQLAARASRPGGKEKLREIQQRIDRDRAALAATLEEGKAVLATVQARKDEADEALSDIAFVLGEVRA